MSSNKSCTTLRASLEKQAVKLGRHAAGNMGTKTVEAKNLHYTSAMTSAQKQTQKEKAANTFSPRPGWKNIQHQPSKGAKVLCSYLFVCFVRVPCWIHPQTLDAANCSIVRRAAPCGWRRLNEEAHYHIRQKQGYGTPSRHVDDRFPSVPWNRPLDDHTSVPEAYPPHRTSRPLKTSLEPPLTSAPLADP